MSGEDFTIPQLKIALWSLLLGIITSGIFWYIIHNKWLALGVIFGLVLMLLNWISLDKILAIAFNFASPQAMKALSFILYQIRFFLVVLIMYVVLTKTNLHFGIGTFLGLLFPKFILGFYVCKARSEEWWLDRVPTNKQSECGKSSPLPEKELANNPFEIDPVEVEVKRYFKIKRGKNYD